MEFLMEYHLAGIMIGVATFLIIGIFHPLVTKGEYYLGVRIWWIFLLMGIAAVIGSVLVENIVWSTLLAVWGASSFWSIGELFEQRKRVEKGWFPKRPEKKERSAVAPCRKGSSAAVTAEANGCFRAGGFADVLFSWPEE